MKHYKGYKFMSLKDNVILLVVSALTTAFIEFTRKKFLNGKKKEGEKNGKGKIWIPKN